MGAQCKIIKTLCLKFFTVKVDGEGDPIRNKLYLNHQAVDKTHKLFSDTYSVGICSKEKDLRLVEF